MLEEKLNIKNMIYEIRGEQVMLDSDLAKLYQCNNGTKDINKAVKRNVDRFPNDFYFQLTDKEKKNLWFQIGTTNNMTRTNPHVFTEQGVAMLSSVLRTKIASKVSINIMRAFVEMRKYISTNLIEQKYINELVLEHDRDIKQLKEAFDCFKDKNNHIFFKGQIYDAYSLMKDIFNKSECEIILIDNYVDKSLFDILSKTNKNVLVITNKYNNENYSKYKMQYNNVKLVINNNFHDRFIIIDKKILYHCGASFKDLGKLCFEISKIDDKTILNCLLLEIKRIISDCVI